MKFKFLFFLLLLLPLTHFGQNLLMKNASKKAINYYNKANSFISSFDYSNAQIELSKALKEEPQFTDALLLSGDIHYDKKQYAPAKAKYLKAKATYSAIPNITKFKIGNCAFKLNNFQEAQKSLNEYLSGSSVNPKKKIIAQEMLVSCAFGIEAIKTPVEFKPILFKSISSDSDDFPPSFTADEKTIIFTRRIGKGITSNEDLFFSEYEQSSNRYATFQDNWSTPIPLSEVINSEDNEGAHASTADGKTIIYTACDRPDSYGNCDIYISKKNGETWTAPQNLGPNINSSYWDSQPSISADGNIIYFSSTRRGGIGGADIYFSTFNNTTNQWNKPVNLGSPVNTPKWENTPFIHPDGETLYFASNGHPGLGGMDLFVSTKIGGNQWIEPKNLGFPLNSTGDEMDLYVSNNGKRAFYSSNGLKNNIGGLDIYYFDLPADKQANLVTYVQGVVTDEKTKNPISSNITLVDLNTGNAIQRIISDKKTGEYIMVLPTGKEYGLSVEKHGYLLHSENFSLNNMVDRRKLSVRCSAKTFRS